MPSRLDIDWQTPHLWRQTAPPRTMAGPLRGDATCDLLVIGGGVTGLGAALAGADAGLDVILLEGNEIGSAASGRNNGQVISHHSRASASEIEAIYGAGTGGRLNALVMRSGDMLFDTIRRFGIDAHGVQNGWIQPCHNAAARARSRKLHDDWKAFGHDVEWLERDEIRHITGSAYLAGWRVRNSGHVNPYALVTGLARALQEQGVRIYETSRATGLRRDGARWRAMLETGSVTADRVVLATNALSGDIWPGLRRAMVPVKVCQAATAPIPAQLRSEIFVGNPAVSDTRRDIRAFHYDRDFRIVTGGTLSLWHSARLRGPARISRMLRDALPQLGPLAQVGDYWEGILAVVPDRRPRLFRLGDGLIFGGIYSGRGVATGLSLGHRMGQHAAGLLDDAAMPLPVTDLRGVPFHAMTTRIANLIHPWHRLRDRLG